MFVDKFVYNGCYNTRVSVVLLGIMGVMVYRKAVATILTKFENKYINQNAILIASSTGSLLSLIFILLFEFMYHRLALWLTNIENPRTQIDFDNSYTYKMYAIAFVNNYAVTFYIAFFKGRFYTYPGDKDLWHTWGGIKSDLCNPAGCIIDLGIQLIIVMLVKNLFLSLMQFITPVMILTYKKFIHEHKTRNLSMVEINTQWEQDYLLNDIVHYHIMFEYMQLIIQYGYVTFFVAAFPLAPLLAMINNFIELRIDAFKLTSQFRRPVPFKVHSMGAWNGILNAVTYLGIATNAFVMAFTTEFVPREFYRTTVNSSLMGYIDWTLSMYNISEFSMKFQPDVNGSVCYFTGKRYPPNHPEKYRLTEEYWHLLTLRFMAVVIFEHGLVLLTGFVAYLVPDIPFAVKEHFNHEKNKMKAIRMKALNESYMKERRSSKTD